MLIPLAIPTPVGGFAVPDAAAGNLSRRARATAFLNLKRVQNRNLSSLKRDTAEEQLESLAFTLMDTQRSIDDIYSKTMEPSAMDDGLPAHGSKCPALGGQYLHIISSGDQFNPTTQLMEPVFLRQEHGLGRVPIGAVWVYEEAGVATPLIRGYPDFNIPRPTDKVVSFLHRGPKGTLSVCVLF